MDNSELLFPSKGEAPAPALGKGECHDFTQEKSSILWVWFLFLDLFGDFAVFCSILASPTKPELGDVEPQELTARGCFPSLDFQLGQAELSSHHTIMGCFGLGKDLKSHPGHGSIPKDSSQCPSLDWDTSRDAILPKFPPIPALPCVLSFPGLVPWALAQPWLSSCSMALLSLVFSSSSQILEGSLSSPSSR